MISLFLQMNFPVHSQDIPKEQFKETFPPILKDEYPINELPEVTYSLDSKGFMVARGQGFQGLPPKSNVSFQIGNEKLDSFGTYNNQILENIRVSLKSIEKATGDLEEGKRKNPIYYPFLYNLGRIYSISGKSEEAIREFENANRIFAYFKNYIHIGLIRESRLQFREAENAYREALKLNPVSGEASYYLCSLSWRQKASLIFREFVRYDGDEPEMEFYSKLCIAENWRLSGRTGKAFDIVRKLNNNFNQPRFHVIYGDLGLEMNHKETAIREYEKAMQFPLDPIFLQISFSVLQKKVNSLKNLK